MSKQSDKSDKTKEKDKTLEKAQTTEKPQVNQSHTTYSFLKGIENKKKEGPGPNNWEIIGTWGIPSKPNQNSNHDAKRKHRQW